MTIDQAYQFIQFCYNKRQGGYITPDQFNNLAPIMQMSLINDRIGNVKKYQPGFPVPSYGFGVTQKSREELRPLLVKPTIVSVTTGVATIPGDYLYYDTISIGGYQAQEVTEDEILEMNNSLIKPPIARFPHFVLHSNGINIYPSAPSSILLSYLRKPLTPLWNYTIVNDESVYSSSGSQDFETGITTHLEICNMILSAIGISLGKLEIAQYAEQQQQMGK